MPRWCLPFGGAIHGALLRLEPISERQRGGRHGVVELRGRATWAHGPQTSLLAGLRTSMPEPEPSEASSPPIVILKSSSSAAVGCAEEVPIGEV